MALIVQKFGGSSVADFSRMIQVAEIVKKTQAQGHQVVVVVSAMYGETDRLISLARTAGKHHLYGREYDALLATGEQVSAALVSMALNNLGCVARSFNASQVRILTNSQHSKATILDIDPELLMHTLQANIIPVVAGFQGMNSQGDITTIGRGGSDLTAVMVAGVLQADECQIFTDVDGVYTSDPRVVKDARRLSHISIEEMWQLAELGAKVLQKNAVKLADRYKIPLRVLSTFSDGPGTLVTYDPVNNQSTYTLSGIAFDRNQAKLTVCGLPNKEGVTNKILSAIKKAAIDVDMIVQNTHEAANYVDFSFTVHRDDYEQAMSIVHTQELDQSQIYGDNSIAKLSVVGVGLHEHATLASKVYQTLTQQGINVQLITSSEVKVSTVVAEQHMELGAQLLHAAFNLTQVKLK